MRKLLIKFTGFLFIVFQSSAMAAVEALDCEKSFQEPQPVLKSLYIEVVDFARATCNALKEDELKALTDRDFLTDGNTQGAVGSALGLYDSAFDESIFPSVKKAKAAWEEYAHSSIFDSNTKIRTDSYELTIADRLNKNITFFGPNRDTLSRDKPSEEMNTACQKLNYEDCLAFFEDIGRVSAIQNSYIKKNYSDSALVNVRAIRAKWTTFSDESRYQTPLDILFTSYLHRKELSDGTQLASPPDYQYFLLHPSVVVDHFSQASKGERDELGLAVEWVGFNSWDSRIPWGLSIASVYSDREEGNSIGHGIMLHINNSFSFGFANRGNGNNSYYINIEFMDWFVDKKGEYKNYYKTYKW